MDSIQPFLAVFLVLGLLCGALWFLKSRGAAVFDLPRGKGGRRIEVIERVALGPQQALHLIRVDGRSILVATAQTNCQILLDMKESE